MKLKIFYNKSVHENAAYYYELAKQSREKAEGAKIAIEQTKKEMKESRTKQDKTDIRVKRDKAWYEKFNYSFTSEGKLMIGGRSAQQNDQVFSRHMETNDLFFHADIQGGSAVILKGGTTATEQELKETAQFTASFSKAWVNANASVDVYAVKKDQVSKHAQGGFIPTGAFAISGQRTWFRATALSLRIGIDKSGIQLIPSISKSKLEKELILIPSKKGKTKSSLAKSLAKRFEAHPDDFLQLLPNGKSETCLVQT
ncbi:DUF814 domain-containing protein [Candidatus Micrarchaeota archaeon]|nr:DUF814 domain-containing protein [Candidatus Micrarchaeota archaeon]MBU1165778.1 DUF814 domain-containing protein [Candidatus Micrarchaeota archaeon]MBU1886778.1 DUF814 domain-containing protein [Candidatus Micrarchaeota archaeon]